MGHPEVPWVGALGGRRHDGHRQAGTALVVHRRRARRRPAGVGAAGCRLRRAAGVTPTRQPGEGWGVLPAGAGIISGVREHSDSSPSARTGVPDRVTGRVLPACPAGQRCYPAPAREFAFGAAWLERGGEMEVPNDPARAGWYTLGPTPGALGPAVIAGHVTWNQMPAVFFRLAELRLGDLVRVVPGRWAGRGLRGHAHRPVREVEISDVTGFRGHRPRGSEAHHVRRRVRRCRAPVQRQRRRLRPADPFLSSTPSVASEDHYRHDLRASPGGRVQQADAIPAEGELDVRR